MLGTSWFASLVIKASVRRTWTQKSRKLERDRIWFGTMKCPASVSVSTEAARNHSSSSIAVTTDNALSGSEQLRDGHLREPADGRRSYNFHGARSLRISPSSPTSYASELASTAFRCYLSPTSLLGAPMRGPISEAVIIVILGFLIGGIAAAVVHFMIDSK